ncbi:MAG: large conductance mechanosensitive channel protein MscL [Eubacteriales bacterium]|nr:large conductance mechanosensitive channel protein MscL [Eubacteriales bacterium]
MSKTKSFFGEFKEFALKGNVVSMAVGVIIGGAFQSIVTSLLDNIINPVIGCFNVGGFNSLAIHVGSADLMVGQFIMDVINFLIMAFVVFMIVKAMNKAMSMGKKEEKPADPTTKVCPFCQSEIDIKATRCPHCTSQLDK